MLKKWCAILMAAAILCGSAISPAAAGSSYLLGDTDDDHMVTILDATEIQRVLAGLKKDESGVVAKRGKITGNKLQIIDATMIQRYLAGFENPYEIGKTITEQGDDYELPFIPG